MVAPQPAPWSAQQSVASRTIASHIASERHNRRIDIRQNTVCTVCKSHDLNFHVLDQLGLLNGVLDNTLNGKAARTRSKPTRVRARAASIAVAGRS